MQQLAITYSVWEAVLAANPTWTYYKVTKGLAYFVFTGHQDVIFESYTEDQSAFDAAHAAAVSAASRNDAVAQLVGLSLQPPRKTSAGLVRTQVDPPEGSRIDVISPNWCDPTTWYYSSVEVLAETLVDSGDGLTFNSANINWIDTSHGKLTDEDGLDTKYKPVIEANGVLQVEDEPFGGAQHDYAINYATGDVTFHSAPATPVTADYWRENGSIWSVQPAAGKVLRLTTVEVQFSSNLVLNDTVQFQLYVGGNPYGPATRYKTLIDYVNEAAGAYPEIPAMGGAQRGTSYPLQIFRWPYAERGTTDLRASLGMEVRISLMADTAFGGEMATATFYGVSEDE